MQHSLLHTREHVGLHHAAADQNSLWRMTEHQECAQLAEIVGFDGPDGIGGRGVFERTSRTSDDRGATGQSFQAVLVIRTNAAKGGIGGMASHINMPELRMHESVNGAPMVNDSHTNAGTDGNVGDAVQMLARAPSQFTQGGTIDVGVKPHGPVDAMLQRPDQIDVLPAGFGRAGNEPKSW